MKEKLEKAGKAPKVTKRELNDEVERNLSFALDEVLKQRSYKEIKKEMKEATQYDAQGNRIRNNRDADGKKKKYVRNDKPQAFWSNLRD